MKTSSHQNEPSALLMGAVLGGILGVLLVSFGRIVSGTPTGIVATIFASAALGAWLGRHVGLLCGTGFGGFVILCGSVISSTALGSLLCVLCCALFAAWLNGEIEQHPHQRPRAVTLRPARRRMAPVSIQATPTNRIQEYIA